MAEAKTEGSVSDSLSSATQSPTLSRQQPPSPQEPTAGTLPPDGNLWEDVFNNILTGKIPPSPQEPTAGTLPPDGNLWEDVFNNILTGKMPPSPQEPPDESPAHGLPDAVQKYIESGRVSRES